MKLLMEPTEDSEKSERNPSRRWDFSEFSVGSISNFISYIILTFAHLGAGPQPMVLVSPCLRQVFIITSNNYQQ